MRDLISLAVDTWTSVYKVTDVKQKFHHTIYAEMAPVCSEYNSIDNIVKLAPMATVADDPRFTNGGGGKDERGQARRREDRGAAGTEGCGGV